MIQRLINFLDNSPVNFLAVNTITSLLEEAGYHRFLPTLPLQNVQVGDKFFVTKNDSSVFAFHIGKGTLADVGFRIICAHCDSPTMRIKPNPEIVCGDGTVKLNTEVYGGAILSTWFDRPLSLAGRVIIRSDDPLQPATRLLHIRRPLLVIPNLAIHFNREVNDGVRISKQKDLLPILGRVSQLEEKNVLINLVAEELSVAANDILDFDLYLYDTTPACLVGLRNEYISAGRLDDLSMVHAGVEALLDDGGAPSVTKVLAVFDNEETGSQTKQGAASPFLSTVLRRIVAAQGGTYDDYSQAVEKAFMISADNAHAWHPNYPEKYDITNRPIMGGGPVIKFNAAQKYVSDAASAAVFASVCERAGVPYQRFVNHSDVAGGSTLGNILASSLPLRGVDMGNPIWAMHSVREMGAVVDHEYCIRAFSEFYRL